MLTIYYKGMLVYLCLICCLSSYSQDQQQNLLDSISGKLIAAIRSQARPRAYLTTDKSIFKAGESIWFRGFLLNSVSQKVTSRNKYFFVDLVNEKDSVASILLLDASTQQLNGQIDLPGNISPGYYWLRAYTRQLAEGENNNCFVKPIYVISQSGKPASKMNITKVLADKSEDIPIMNFFPEGGAIMTGANSTIAFLIQNPEGRPVAAEGYIKDSRDSIVGHFSSNKGGFGKFDLFASSFRKYKAYLSWKGKEISYLLPSFNFYAAQIAVTTQKDGKRTLRVLLEDSLYREDLISYVIGISKDSLCFAAIGRGLYELAIPEQKFPEGIATFYLFDKNLRLLSERSIYIKETNLIVKAVVDKNVYGKRDKVNLTVSITDAANHPVPSLFSVSVTDTAFLNPDDECKFPDFNDSGSINNMTLSHMQCFTGEDMDAIMLLKKKAAWDQSKNLAKASLDNSDSLLFIKGKVLDEKNQPATNKILTLLSNSGNALFLTDTTDYKGQFSFPVFDYADNTQFAIEARNLNNKSVNVKIVRDPVPFPKFSTPVFLKCYFAKEPVFTGKYRNAYLDTTYINPDKHSLPPVNVVGKKEAKYNQSKRVSSSSSIIAADQLDERQSVGNIVQQVGGVHMLNGYLIINGLTAFKAPDASSEPLILIDGVAAPSPGISVGDVSPAISILNSLNPKDIDFIEILKGGDAANYGIRGGNGVILINMSSSRKENFTKAGGNLQTFYAKGISKSSPFPAINYDNKETMASENFDNRSTIFWDGSILSGTDEHISLSFFTSDIPTTYKVTINGITTHGDIVYKTLIFHSK